ncbi:helix-turn-helix domain-containing protein [Chengkuizengella axinellae]|uniref:Helix-turn-helix transcriptional regulator n=1 Tax=Chengkuizengella axinellae TaxID=3064388 RepID=A0ABT9IYS4_9BACL|nr:helix-turn-helix transcriptional regulator [Chengkuizengella sp. 2205SS18-9]MDP5274378.1 helix-turn-helix transcriptional regulator [Chengkuizengella sp. 2205SS18-9]
MALRFGRSRLPELIKANRTTQRELGKRLGFSESFVSQIISGKATLSLIKAKEASMILNCSIDDLYEWELE